MHRDSLHIATRRSLDRSDRRRAIARRARRSLPPGATDVGFPSSSATGHRRLHRRPPPAALPGHLGLQGRTRRRLRRARDGRERRDRSRARPASRSCKRGGNAVDAAVAVGLRDRRRRSPRPATSAAADTWSFAWPTDAPRRSTIARSRRSPRRATCTSTRTASSPTRASSDRSRAAFPAPSPD